MLAEFAEPSFFLALEAVWERCQIPVPYRRESSRLCSEGDKSSTLSHMTDGSWQKPELEPQSIVRNPMS